MVNFLIMKIVGSNVNLRFDDKYDKLMYETLQTYVRFTQSKSVAENKTTISRHVYSPLLYTDTNSILHKHSIAINKTMRTVPMQFSVGFQGLF